MRAKLLNVVRLLSASLAAQAPGQAEANPCRIGADADADAAAAAAAAAAENAAPRGGFGAVSAASVADIVDRLLDRLEATGLLDDARVAESRVHVRSARYGVRRIQAELSRLGVSATTDALAALRASEPDRARAVWARKYGCPATDAAGRARQARFLAGRGFSSDAIRRVLAIDAAPEDDGPALPVRTRKLQGRADD